MARLRAALILVDNGSYADVSARVEALTVDTNTLRHSAREALGLSAWKEGQRRRCAEALRPDRRRRGRAAQHPRARHPAGRTDPRFRRRVVMPAMSFTVAIVGRPNVGKSTLFNRLAGRKLALVDDTPGVTRDRRVHRRSSTTSHFDVIDTAGFEDAAAETLQGRMRAQTEIAIDEADLDLLHDRRQGRPAAGRPHLRRHRAQVRQAGRAGRQQGRGARRRGRHAEAWEARPRRADRRSRPSMARACPICATRSSRRSARSAPSATTRTTTTICRRATSLIGEDIADPDAEAGLRRHQADAHRHRRPAECRQVDADQRADRRGAAADRPGGRHHARFDLGRLGLARPPASSCSTPPACAARRRVQEKLEKLSVADGLRAIRFAEVVVIVFDATIPFEKQDLQIADLIVREGRAPVIAFNKWDLIDEPQAAAGRTAREDRAAAAAGARPARRAGLGRDRPRPRQADGGGPRDAPGLEQPHLDRPAQPLAGRRARRIIRRRPSPAAA